MMRRRFTVLLSLAALTACGGVESTAPARQIAPPALRDNSAPSGGDLHDGRMIPGVLGQAGTAPAATGNRLACNVPSTLTNSAVIGAKGGELDFGPHRLIVPPGALTHDTLLSATMPAGSTMIVELQPHGLQFLKPAGLQLDLTSCAAIPNVVYLDGLDGPEHIQAVFSEWWHTIAAPLDHFSGYAVDM